MNLVLFKTKRDKAILSRKDTRSVHILEILGRKEGESFDVGVENGSRGKATIVKVHKDALEVAFNWLDKPPPPFPLTLLMGLPRPQTARKILTEGTSLGCAEMCFFQSEKGESSYAESRLWTSTEWMRQIRKGAEQAFTTHIPVIRHFKNLGECLHKIHLPATRLALDNYEAEGGLSTVSMDRGPVVIALGSERGWSDLERKILRGSGFQVVHLGERVLRMETACSVAVGIVASRLNWI